MKAFPDIDAFLAENVMGWIVDPIYRIYPGTDRDTMLHCNPEGNAKLYWSPTTQPDAMREVAERLGKKVMRL